MFPQKGICDRTELFYRTAPEKSGSPDSIYWEEGNCLTINRITAFDTYFNSLAVIKYREYCHLSALYLRLRVSGFFVLRVFGVKKIDGVFRETLILKKDIKASVKTYDITELTDSLDRGYDSIYFSLESKGGRLYGGEYLCCTDKQKTTDIAVVICTYKREKFLMRNYSSICSYLEKSKVLKENNIHFYIVDNGRTLDPEKIDNPYFTLIPNSNTGGSGGFTRGCYEAVNSGRSYTHVLFMDDDIVLDCEMLMRVYALLRIRRSRFDDLAVGGTMIRLSDMITQHEAGSVWDGKRLNSIGNGIDLTVRENVLDIPYYPKGNYNAWWFCCFPVSWVREHGYPLQFFVKEDDIEYSLRCAHEIAVISGIAVWHDDFDGKYDGFQEYYIKRNELILTSVNDQKPYTAFQIRKLILSVMKQTVYQRYFLADIIFRAYNDYLKGWEHFKNTDTAAFNQELMSSCESLMGDEELREKYGVYFDREKYEKSLAERERLKIQALSLNGYLIPSVFYPKDKDGFYITDLARCRIVNFYRHKKVLHYDTARKRGFVTVQKRTKLYANYFRLIGMSIKFAVKYPSVRRGYREHLKELADYKPDTAE